MRIKHDFSTLWEIVDELKAVRESFSLTRTSSISEIEIQLNKGKVVKLSELESVSGLLAYKGRQVLLYIPDQGKNITRVLAGDKELGKKFHVAHCRTLETMKESGRFERYIATTDVSGIFQLAGINEIMKEVNDIGSLYVCQNCLNMLNYKQAKVNKSARHIRERFDLSEFFETYSSCFLHLPSRVKVTPGLSAYPKNWGEISTSLRLKSEWICSECKINLKDHKHLLHVHHVDGVKSHVAEHNLRVLCKACHRLQPLHDHLYIPLEEMKLINSIRKKNGVFKTGWPGVLKYADPACLGVLGFAHDAGWFPPEIEYVISSDSVPVEAAWPSRKVALSLVNSRPLALGWQSLTLANAASFDFSMWN